MKSTITNGFCIWFGILAWTVSPVSGQDKLPDGWISLFNGKDTTGWKLKSDTYMVTKYVDGSGAEIKGGKETKLDQKSEIQDAKGKPIAGAKVAKIDKKYVIVDAESKPIPGAKIAKVGGRTAVVDAKGVEVKDAKKVQEAVKNRTGGWTVEIGELTCGVGPKGVDLLTEQKFSDFELHVEFKATSNNGVYLQGRYEIQIDNSFNVKPKIEEKDGKKVEALPKTMCGALYSQVAPSKNMAKTSMEWQTFDITFKAPRGEKGKITQKARITLVWNGETVLDNIEVPNGTALDPGPILLQGDHGKVTFRNIKIKPASGN
jgi:hypothetical protein